MKKKISISIDEKTICLLDTELSKDFFRNKSHLIEHAIKQYLGDRDE